MGAIDINVMRQDRVTQRRWKAIFAQNPNRSVQHLNEKLKIIPKKNRFI
jgi:hypothetical protein